MDHLRRGAGQTRRVYRPTLEATFEIVFIASIGRLLSRSALSLRDAPRFGKRLLVDHEEPRLVARIPPPHEADRYGSGASKHAR
jgi:hypothetical protein